MRHGYRDAQRRGEWRLPACRLASLSTARLGNGLQEESSRLIVVVGADDTVLNLLALNRKAVFRCHYGSSALHWYANSASSTINDVVTPGANLSRFFVAGIESPTHAAAFHGICGFAVRPDKLLRLNRRASYKKSRNGGNEYIFETHINLPLPQMLNGQAAGLRCPTTFVWISTH